MWVSAFTPCKESEQKAESESWDRSKVGPTKKKKRTPISFIEFFTCFPFEFPFLLGEYAASHSMYINLIVCVIE